VVFYNQATQDVIMDEFILFIQQNIHIAPYAIFGLLLLAGFNLPVSEDLMLFISATLAAQYPDQLIPLFIGVFMGVYWSDVISFYLGRILGPHIFKIKFFAKMMNPQKVEWFKTNIEKYGILTFIIGRFIPFGVRNGIFLTSGITGVKPIKFCIYDFIAASISTSVFFTAYYFIGLPMIEYIKKFNLIIFIIFALSVLIFLIVRKRQKRHA